MCLQCLSRSFFKFVVCYVGSACTSLKKLTAVYEKRHGLKKLNTQNKLGELVYEYNALGGIFRCIAGLLPLSICSFGIVCVGIARVAP